MDLEQSLANLHSRLLSVQDVIRGAGIAESAAEATPDGSPRPEAAIVALYEAVQALADVVKQLSQQAAPTSPTTGAEGAGPDKPA